MPRREPVYPLLTRDPASGDELIVTRLESPTSGVVIEGRFSLGWIARLTPEQVDFVGLLVKYRANVQKLANEVGIAYNTARSRLDEIVEALGGAPGDRGDPAVRDDDQDAEGRARRRVDVLEKLASGDLSFDEALRQLRSH